jgi:sec-independent protein translocase protein TatB
MFDFLGIGMWELLLILVVALIVVGPEKIPEIAQKTGKVMRALKKTTSDLMAEVNREIEIEETHSKNPKNNMQSSAQSLPDILSSSLNVDDGTKTGIEFKK